MPAKDIICILIAYLLGGICTGYYLVRLKANLDIRDLGSGGVGGRNVGRVLGRPGLIITLAGDSLKGIVAVALARKFEIAEPAVSLVLVAVIAGHIWPLPLQFRGGRGIATAVGALLAFDPVLVLLLLCITLALMVFRQGFTISGLAAFLFLPVLAHGLDMPGHAVTALAGAAVIVLFAHRERIRQAFAEAFTQREA
jgi:glycerol-3-phosphate acyltransferase PlsY